MSHVSPLLQHDPAEAEPGACEPGVYGEHENEEQPEPSCKNKNDIKNYIVVVVLCHPILVHHSVIYDFVDAMN